MKRSPSSGRFFEKVRQDGKEIVVIKIGTSSLINAEGGTLAISKLAKICELVKTLKEAGMIVLLVSSGAVGVGCQRLGVKKYPSTVAQKQACAAIGQLHLMRYYSDFFASLGLTCGQVLLTADTFTNHPQFLNARNTFLELMTYDVIPIINENDTVAVEQIRIGDNDTLSARVAIMCEADWLVMCTDVDNLYTSNPRTNSDAKPIYEVHNLHQLEVDTGTNGTQWGTGGMATKLTAVRLATAAGCNAAVCNAAHPEKIVDLINGEKIGTKFFSRKPERGRKRWILSVPVSGTIWIDDGAVTAVMNQHASLFAAGIVKVIGNFSQFDAVTLCNKQGEEFARGLVNYSSSELKHVMGQSSSTFVDVLDGYSAEEMIHRNNLCLLFSKPEEHKRSMSSLH